MQLRNEAIGDSRLRPWVRNLPAPLGTSRWIIRYVANSKSVSVFGHYVKTWRHPQNWK